MPIINKPFTHEAGTQAQSAKVNANEDLIYNLVNGNLTDANIGVSAAIQQSKIANLQTDLGSKKVANDVYVAKYLTETPVVNTAGETAIQIIDFPAGTINATDAIHASSRLSINGILSASQLVVTYYYLPLPLLETSQLMHSTAVTNSDASFQSFFTLIADIWLYNRNQYNAQGFSVVTELAPSTTLVTMSNRAGGGGAGIFGTGNGVRIQVDVQWSVASASNYVTGLGLIGQRIR